MSKCSYTAQGKFVCIKDKEKYEHFLDTVPNMKESACIIINKKLNDVISPYNCNAQITNTPQKCTFQYECNDN